ncbi:MAG: histidinol-phosphatase HisJ family protein [Bacteroidota bacterium]
MLVDYHLHTWHCRHADDEVRSYALAAWDRGLDEIGFADHVPCLGWREETQRSMPAAELPDYVREVAALAAEFPGRVRLGLEVDFVPGFEDALAGLKRSHPFDYWIGSVHFIPAWSYGYVREYRDRPPLEAFRRYYSLMAGAARSGLFEILGHLDLIRRFVPAPDPSDLAPLEEDLVASVASAGVAVELNCAALRGGDPEVGILPGPRLLRLLAEAGVPVTFGSDAHRSAEAGEGVAHAAALARRAGFTSFVRFQAGRALVTPLGEV